MLPIAIARYLKRSQPEQSEVVYLPDKARAMGILFMAGKGSGKSRAMGRVICYQDLRKGRAQVILDPNGPTIDNLLDRVNRLPAGERERALERIIYVDMSGKTGYVVSWPLYYRYPDESLYEAAVRLVEVIRRLDPALATASVEGFNAIAEVGIYGGMVASALCWQITRIPDLIEDPVRFTSELQWVATTYPEARRAVAYFLEVLPSLKPAEKERKVGSFLRKIAVFTLDPVLQAMVGQCEHAIDWQRVVDEGKTVLLDFRSVLDSERRRFFMLWTFRSFLAFVKRRGAGRHTPLGLVVDELTALYNFDVQAGSSIFAADLDELINVLARNYQVWLLLALQELFQIDEKSRKTLFTMGTKIIGVTSDSQSALILAQSLMPFDPTLIKHFEPIYDMRGSVIDFAPQYWSIQEQQLLGARVFQTLKPFHFLVKVSQREGDAGASLQPLSIANIEPGVWVDERAVSALRAELAARSGWPLRALARVELDAPATEAPSSAPPAAAPQSAAQEITLPPHEEVTHDTLEAYVSADTDGDDLSFFRETRDPNTY